MIIICAMLCKKKKKTKIRINKLVNDELINKDGNLSVIKEGRFNVTNTQYLGLLAHSAHVYLICVFVCLYMFMYMLCRYV